MLALSIVTVRHLRETPASARRHSIHDSAAGERILRDTTWRRHRHRDTSRGVTGRPERGVRRERPEWVSVVAQATRHRCRARHSRDRGRDVPLLVARQSLYRILCKRKAEKSSCERAGHRSRSATRRPGAAALGIATTSSSLRHRTLGVLQRVSGAGGVPQAASALDTAYGETSHRFPSFLPDGRHFVYSGTIGTCCPASKAGRIRIGTLDTMDATTLLEAESSAAVASGHLLFNRNGTLMAQPFDATLRQFARRPVSNSGVHRVRRQPVREFFGLRHWCPGFREWARATNGAVDVDGPCGH